MWSHQETWELLCSRWCDAAKTLDQNQGMQTDWKLPPLGFSATAGMGTGQVTQVEPEWCGSCWGQAPCWALLTGEPVSSSHWPRVWSCRCDIRGLSARHRARERTSAHLSATCPFSQLRGQTHWSLYILRDQPHMVKLHILPGSWDWNKRSASTAKNGQCASVKKDQSLAGSFTLLHVEPGQLT